MTCDSLKSFLLDYLYNEIDNENRKIVEAHLEICENCSGEFLALKETSQTLQRMETVPSPMNLVFVKDPETLWHRIQEGITSISGTGWSWGRRLGIAFAVVLVVFSLANLEFTHKNDEFGFKMSLWPRSAPEVQSTSQITPADLIKFREEQIALMNQIINTSQEQQKREWTLTFLDFAREMEQKRQSDLRMVGSSFEQLHYQTQNELLRANQNIDGLRKIMRVNSSESGSGR